MAAGPSSLVTRTNVSIFDATSLRRFCSGEGGQLRPSPSGISEVTGDGPWWGPSRLHEVLHGALGAVDESQPPCGALVHARAGVHHKHDGHGAHGCRLSQCTRARAPSSGPSAPSLPARTTSASRVAPVAQGAKHCLVPVRDPFVHVCAVARGGGTGTVTCSYSHRYGYD